MMHHSSKEPTEEGSYLASVSDLMSALLYIFILAVVVFTLDLLTAEESVREVEAEKREEIRQLRGADDARAEMLERLESALRQRGLTVEIDVEHGVVRLPEEVLFRSGRDQFNPGGEERLAMLAEELEILLPCYSFGGDCPDRNFEASLEAVVVEGHTDDQPLRAGSQFRDNWELSAARSIRTFGVLMAHRPQLRTFVNQKGEPLFGIAGYADSRRVAPETTPEARERNRRIDLRFIMSVPKKYIVEGDSLREEET